MKPIDILLLVGAAVVLFVLYRRMQSTAPVSTGPVAAPTGIAGLQAAAGGLVNTAANAGTSILHSFSAIASGAVSIGKSIGAAAAPSVLGVTGLGGGGGWTIKW